VTAQSHAKAQRDLEKREREILAVGSRLLSNFNHQTPPKFNGEGGPETADLWLQSVERIFGAIHCPEGEKVVLATYQLLGGSEYWWRNTRIIMENGHEELNWENFKRRFLAKYFPETARERYGEEFLRLRQAGMNVEAATSANVGNPEIAKPNSMAKTDPAKTSKQTTRHDPSVPADPDVSVSGGNIYVGNVKVGPDGITPNVWVDRNGKRHSMPSPPDAVPFPGITKEQFDHMTPEQRQKLMEARRQLQMLERQRLNVPKPANAPKRP
jgi:hypothetical protein